MKAALGELDEDERARIRVADAPLVEGAVAAGVIASTGEDAGRGATGGGEAWNAGKL